MKNNKPGSNCRMIALTISVMLISSCLLSACGSNGAGADSSTIESASAEASGNPSTAESASAEASGNPSTAESASAEASINPSTAESASAEASINPSTAESASAETSESPSTDSSAASSDSSSSTLSEKDADYAAAIDTTGMPHIDPDDYPKVDGSTATLPLSTVLYALTTDSTMEEAENAITHTKTRNAYYGLVNNWRGEYNTDLVLAYEPSDDIVDTLEQSGVTLTKKAIGRDALVFLANQGNPVESLSGQQIVDIYSGRIRNWSKVGGENKPIDAFQRPQNSGSQTLMEKLVMKGTQLMDAPSYKRPSEMEGLMESVSAYDNSRTALGYSVYYYAHNMYSMPGIRFMQVNGVTPSNDTIRSGEYPYVNDFYAVIRADEPADSPVRQLFNWLTEDGGQQLIGELGYVSVKKTDASSNTGSSSETDTQNASSNATFSDSGSPSGWLISRSGQSFDFPDNQVILMDGASIAEIPEVVILDSSFNEKNIIHNASIRSGIFALADTDTPLILVDTQKGLYGLYSLAEHKWLVAPDYDYISAPQDNTGNWNLWKYAQWNEAAQEYEGDDYHDVWNETTHKLTTLPGSSDSAQVGNHYWSSPDADGVITITDANGKKTGTVSLTALGLNEGYSDGNYYEAYETDGDSSETVLLDEDGNIVFSRDSLTDREIARIIGTSEELSSWHLSIYRISDSGIISGGFYADGPTWREYDFLYRLSDEKLLTGSQVSVYSLYATEQSDAGPAAGSDQQEVFVVTSQAEDDSGSSKSSGSTSTETSSYVLDASGSRMKAQDGTPFLFALSGGNLFGYADTDGNVVIESGDGKQLYRPEGVTITDLDLPGGYLGEGIAKGIYTLGLHSEENDNYTSTVFRGNRRLTGEDPYAWTMGNGYSVVGLDGTQSVYEADTGRKLMSLPDGEYLSFGQDGVFVTSGGNFYHFRKEDGDEIARIATSLEGDD